MPAISIVDPLPVIAFAAPMPAKNVAIAKTIGIELFSGT